MLTFSDFKNAVEQQLYHNQDKSLFYELANGSMVLNTSKETAVLLTQSAKEISEFLEAAKEDGTYKKLLDYISGQSIQLFIEVNQYLNFNLEDNRKLENIYGNFLERICRIADQEEISENELEHLFAVHYKNLQRFLLESNGAEIFKNYRETSRLFEVKCAEYSPEFQFTLLNINLATIKQPVLDIGCGSRASLVRFLRENGIEAFGMDRSLNSEEHLFKMNWLECPFESNTWGTVISHMAFSNHFIHHHIKTDGHFEIYARQYMQILKSLKLGGSFFYAPGLSFIEEVLRSSNNSFIVERYENSTRVTRIR